ncbi:MAG: phoR5 [Clostridiaceae bacterium]|nr:phoR5 [Clostridiaceae bacterium]
MKISIKHKVLISFTLVFLSSILTLYYFTNEIINNSNENIIKREMTETRKNIDTYINQYFILKNIFPDKVNFESQASILAKDLSYKMESKVELYSIKGVLLSETSIENGAILGSNSDLLKAKQGQTSYVINKIGNKSIVNLSYPISLNNSDIGYVRYSRDYTELIASGENILKLIKMSLIVIIIVLFIVSFILSNHITKPILQLTLLSKNASLGNLNEKFNLKSNDEIGQLGESFNTMINKINDQIETIKQERDTIKELESNRKVFFDNVTHEFKTPLTTILGYAEIIKDNGFNDEDFFNKGINHIILESKRLNKMVIELLEISKLSNIDFKYNLIKINLSKIIINLCEEMKLRAEKYNIVIIPKIQRGLYILGDEDKIKELFINLLDNSIKYARVNSDVNITAVRNNNGISIKVDNLCDSMDNHKVREKGSSGLGLSIVKAIVEKHNGIIKIENLLKGRFSVYINFTEIK